MRKDILLPGLAVGGGAACLALRQWQLRSAYDAGKQLFAHGAPATYALLLLTVVLAAALAVLVRTGKGPSDFLSAFRCPAPLYMAGMAAAAFLFLGAGVLGLLYGLDELTLWRLDPKGHLLTYPAAILLCALLCFPSGLACLQLGKGAYRGHPAQACSLMALFPACTGLVWLFATHLEHSTDPILLGYGFPLTAAALLMLAHYETAAFFHGRPHPRRALFFSLTGTVLGLASLLDGLPTFFQALTAAFLLSALSGACALARNLFGPPWPRRLLSGRMPLGAEEEDNEEDIPHQDCTEEL